MRIRRKLQVHSLVKLLVFLILNHLITTWALKGKAIYKNRSWTQEFELICAVFSITAEWALFGIQQVNTSLYIFLLITVSLLISICFTIYSFYVFDLVVPVPTDTNVSSNYYGHTGSTRYSHSPREMKAGLIDEFVTKSVLFSDTFSLYSTDWIIFQNTSVEGKNRFRTVAVWKGYVLFQYLPYAIKSHI